MLAGPTRPAENLRDLSHQSSCSLEWSPKKAVLLQWSSARLQYIRHNIFLKIGIHKPCQEVKL